MVEILCVVAAGYVAAKAANSFGRAGYRLSQRIIRKKITTEELTQQLLGRVVGHLHFLDDHPLFVLELLLIESREEQHVGKKIERTFELVVDDLDRKARLFVSRKRLEIAAQTVLFDRYIQCRTPLRALKNRVLDKMRNAAQACRFVCARRSDKKSRVSPNVRASSCQ